MPDMRSCPRCGRSYALDFCKSKARKEKIPGDPNADQKSFKCECGDVPYRELDGAEVTEPRRVLAAKEKAEREAAVKKPLVKEQK